MKKYFFVSAYRGNKFITHYKLMINEHRLIGQIAQEYDRIEVEIKEMEEEHYKLIFGI